MSNFNEIQITSFKGIKDLHLRNFSKINIFVGLNNAGKTSILEAIKLISKPLNPVGLVFKNRLIGEFTPHEVILNSFPIGKDLISVSAEIEKKEISFKVNKSDSATKKIIESDNTKLNTLKQKILSLILKEDLQDDTLLADIEADLAKTKLEKEFNSTTLEFSLNRSGKILSHKWDMLYDNQSTSLKSEDDENQVELELIKCKLLTDIESFPNYNGISTIMENDELSDRLINTLKILDNGISNIKILYKDKKPSIIFSHKTLGNLPLHLYGSGFVECLNIISSISNTENGILLIDEIGKSIHISFLNELFKLINFACEQFNTQLFVTTHSNEILDAILSNANENHYLDQVRLYQISNSIEKTRVKTFNGNEAYELRSSFGEDLR